MVLALSNKCEVSAISTVDWKDEEEREGDYLHRHK